MFILFKLVKSANYFLHLMFVHPVLRSWIQAACVTSATWTIGGILAGKDRSLFDSKLRDILMGRSNEDPLPPILNNKFDALPPAEGLVYDFVFDFKATEYESIKVI